MERELMKNNSGSWIPNKEQKVVMATIARMTIDCMAHCGTVDERTYIFNLQQYIRILKKKGKINNG